MLNDKVNVETETVIAAIALDSSSRTDFLRVEPFAVGSVMVSPSATKDGQPLWQIIGVGTFREFCEAGLRLCAQQG